MKKKELLLEYKVKFDQSGTTISEDIICTSKNIPIQWNNCKSAKGFLLEKDELRN